MSRFSVLGKVAAGTAVDLFLAQDQRSGSRVIVEALRPELISHAGLVEGVVQQARLREGLEHPNLSRRLRSVASSEGRHHWLSEPLQGETLRSHLATNGPLTPRDAVRVLIELCDVVSYLHHYGFTHGSLSPEYVIFDAQQLRPKLLDSGLTLYRFEGVTPVLGSRVLVRPEYLSPERIQGQRADAQSDVYALGVLLFELLHGTPPFAAKDADTVRQKHLRDPLPQLAAELKVLEPLIHTSMAKVRSARVKDVASLQRSLIDLKGRIGRGSQTEITASRMMPVNGREATPIPNTHGPVVDLQAQFPSRRSVLSSASAKGSSLTLFVPTDRQIKSGTPLKLRLSLGDSHRMFDLFGTALNDSLGARGHRLSGVNVGFFADQKKKTAEMLAFCADRPPTMGTAGCRRFPVTVTCRLRASTVRADGQVLDLSRTGAFITTSDPHHLATATEVHLKLNPRLMGMLGGWVHGEVVWRGRKSGRYGVGVRFVGDNSHVVSVLDRYAGKAR